ncbi:hypothetical protein DQ04_00121310 [Trypanosoma grayi]|uniref:hypothetical protein n=1 Tax=Trypanosoma grayi TaxID=71804 RepID=UPI0004F42EDD|nr:hypothetical protein DQ04_00121310 [Trypanosoma grayi]KEG15299.1 hypothetical protein DQ04_00121310 [Trypanosoma grayi]
MLPNRDFLHHGKVVQNLLRQRRLKTVVKIKAQRATVVLRQKRHIVHEELVARLVRCFVEAHEESAPRHTKYGGIRAKLLQPPWSSNA